MQHKWTHFLYRCQTRYYFLVKLNLLKIAHKIRQKKKNDRNKNNGRMWKKNEVKTIKWTSQSKQKTHINCITFKSRTIQRLNLSRVIFDPVDLFKRIEDLIRMIKNWRKRKISNLPSRTFFLLCLFQYCSWTWKW